MKLCFFGCGNIAQAIIDGLLKNGVQYGDISCIERNPKKIQSLKEKNLKVLEPKDLSNKNFDLVLLAVKPKDALIAEKIIFKHAPETTILTTVAGIELNNYSKPRSVIRSMPNTACAFGKGVTALYGSDSRSNEFQLAQKLFNKIGHTLLLKKEEEMHTFTSIIGSGQAFIFEVLKIYFFELKQIEIKNKIDATDIFKFFVSSLGDSFEQEPDFETLINKIKSPGGTTQAGLESLEKSEVANVFRSAFEAAKKRSIEISNEHN